MNSISGGSGGHVQDGSVLKLRDLLKLRDVLKLRGVLMLWGVLKLRGVIKLRGVLKLWGQKIYYDYILMLLDYADAARQRPAEGWPWASTNNTSQTLSLLSK